MKNKKIFWDRMGYYLLCIITLGWAWAIRVTLTVAIQEGLKKEK